jgi:hypothetical protein
MVTIRAHWACQAFLSRLTLAHLAGTLLLVASGLANFKYGLSLGHSELEKAIAGGASIGADVWNAAGLVLLAWCLKRKLYGQATAAGVILSFTVMYSIVAGVGFGSSTLNEKFGRALAVERTDKSRVDRLARIDGRLSEIGSVRPAATLQSIMDEVLADKRAEGCRELNGRYTKEHCPKYFAAKAELGLASERDQLVTERYELASKVEQAETVQKADPLADALGAYLRLIGLQPSAEGLHHWQTFLFVVLVVLGGPVMWWVAESKREATRPPTLYPAANENRQAENTEPETVVEPEPAIVARPRKLVPVTPSGALLLERLKSTGRVEGKSHNVLATQLGVPRTSFRRIVDRLESFDMVKLTHDPKKRSYRLEAA